MKFKVIDPKTGRDMIGGEVDEGNALLMSVAPVDDSPDFRQLEIGRSGLYETTKAGEKTTMEILRTA